MTEFTVEQWEALKARAVELGTEHGTRAAGWVVIDGEQSARWWLTGIEQGDPKILDLLPDRPLSGEHADSFDMHDLYRSLEITAEDDSDDLELCLVYEDAYRAALQSGVERRARECLPVDNPTP